MGGGKEEDAWMRGRGGTSASRRAQLQRIPPAAGAGLACGAALHAGVDGLALRLGSLSAGRGDRGGLRTGCCKQLRGDTCKAAPRLIRTHSTAHRPSERSSTSSALFVGRREALDGAAPPRQRGHAAVLPSRRLCALDPGRHSLEVRQEAVDELLRTRQRQEREKTSRRGWCKVSRGCALCTTGRRDRLASCLPPQYKQLPAHLARLHRDAQRARALRQPVRSQAVDDACGLAWEECTDGRERALAWAPTDEAGGSARCPPGCTDNPRRPRAAAP